jgi:hypothetical protein
MWFADHPVATSAIVAGVIVLAAIGYAAWRALQLWRTIKAEKAKVMERVTAVQDEVAKVERGVAGLTARQGDIDGAIKELMPRIAGAKVLADHAGKAVGVFTSPLRYVGR